MSESDKADQTFQWTFTDSLWLALWYGLLGGLVYMFGWVIGVVAYFLFYQAVSQVLFTFFGLEMMTGPDFVFCKDDQKTNLMNIIAFNKFQRIDIDTIRNLTVKRSTRFQRMRSAGAKIMGRYMFKDLGAEYVIKNQNKYFKACSGVHNEDQLAEFMEKQQGIREPLDDIQWRVFFFEDYSETESVFVFKVHHCLIDGISSILMYLNLCDDPDIKNVPQIMVRFTLVQKIVQMVLSPFQILWLGVKLLALVPTDYTHFRKPEVINNLSTPKRMAICKDLSIDIVKKRSKELNCTINDIIMTATSKTLKMHLEAVGDSKTQSIQLAFPFSLRPPPRTVDDIQLVNNFAIMPVTTRLVNDCVKGLDLIKRDMHALKNSMEPLGWQAVTVATGQLPHMLIHLAFDLMCTKFAFGFSNVPGPRQPFIVGGSASSSLGFAMPVGKTVSGSLGIISHADCIKATFMIDKACADPKVFRDYFEKSLDEILGSTEWRNWKAGYKKN